MENIGTLKVWIVITQKNKKVAVSFRAEYEFEIDGDFDMDDLHDWIWERIFNDDYCRKHVAMDKSGGTETSFEITHFDFVT